MLETRDRGPQKPCVSRFKVVGGVMVMSVSCFGKRVVVGNKKDPVTQNASGRGAGHPSLISCERAVVVVGRVSPPSLKT